MYGDGAVNCRYSSVISLRKSVALVGASWLVSIAISATCLASLPPLSFRSEFGGCLPVFRHNAVFPVAYYSLGFVLPICVVIAFNLKIVSIAKYHQYRWVSKFHWHFPHAHIRWL